MEQQITEEETRRLVEINTAMTTTVVQISEMQKNVLTTIKNNTKDEFILQLIEHCFEEEEELRKAQIQMVLEGAVLVNKIKNIS